MDVSKNSGTPKSSISIEFSILNHPFWGTIIFGNTHMHILCLCRCIYNKRGQPASLERWIQKDRVLCATVQTNQFDFRGKCFDMRAVFCVLQNHTLFITSSWIETNNLCLTSLLSASLLPPPLSLPVLALSRPLYAVPALTRMSSSSMTSTGCCLKLYLKLAA